MIQTKNIGAIVTGALLLSASPAQALLHTGNTKKPKLSTSEIVTEYTIRSHGLQPQKPDITDTILGDPELLATYKTEYGEYQAQAKIWNCAFLKNYGAQVDTNQKYETMVNYVATGSSMLLAGGVMSLIALSFLPDNSYKGGKQK